MWYITMRRVVRPRDEWAAAMWEHLAEHLDWMRQQHEAGRILFSGPTPDRQLGIYVIKADSRVEAEQVAASDPFTARGWCAFDLIEWEVHQILGAGRFVPPERPAHR